MERKREHKVYRAVEPKRETARTERKKSNLRLAGRDPGPLKLIRGSGGVRVVIWGAMRRKMVRGEERRRIKKTAVIRQKAGHEDYVTFVGCDNTGVPHIQGKLKNGR